MLDRKKQLSWKSTISCAIPEKTVELEEYNGDLKYHFGYRRFMALYFTSRYFVNTVHASYQHGKKKHIFEYFKIMFSDF